MEIKFFQFILLSSRLRILSDVNELWGVARQTPREVSDQTEKSE